jgi:hypothetical protein
VLTSLVLPTPAPTSTNIFALSVTIFSIEPAFLFRLPSSEQDRSSSSRQSPTLGQGTDKKAFHHLLLLLVLDQRPSPRHKCTGAISGNVPNGSKSRPPKLRNVAT